MSHRSAPRHHCRVPRARSILVVLLVWLVSLSGGSAAGGETVTLQRGVVRPVTDAHQDEPAVAHVEHELSNVDRAHGSPESQATEQPSSDVQTSSPLFDSLTIDPTLFVGPGIIHMRTRVVTPIDASHSAVSEERATIFLDSVDAEGSSDIVTESESARSDAESDAADATTEAHTTDSSQAEESLVELSTLKAEEVVTQAKITPGDLLADLSARDESIVERLHREMDVSRIHTLQASATAREKVLSCLIRRPTLCLLPVVSLGAFSLLSSPFTAP